MTLTPMRYTPSQYQLADQTTTNRFGLIIIVLVPMTVVTPVPLSVRIIVVIILAIVVWIIVMLIIAPVVYRIRVAISGPDRYTKVPVRLRSLRQESDKAKR
jgi:hypothetical protein